MNFISLFAGMGGFELGFERAGMQCVYQVENAPHCRSVLAYHWSDVNKEVEDVKNFGKSVYDAPVDLICGGFPCQDLSVAGQRTGLAGDRSGLWWEFARIIGELYPRWVVIENVPGLLSSSRGRDMGTILTTLGKFGYGWAYASLDAQYYNVAQRRKRVFIVGCLGDRTSAAKVLFESESGAWDSAPCRETGQRVATYACRRAQTSSNGWGIQEEVVHTLDKTGGDAVAYGLTTHQTPKYARELQPTLQVPSSSGGGQPPAVVEIHGGSKRKDRPNGGFYVREMPTTKPLDTSGLNPNCAQGGVVAFDWQSGGDVRLNVSGEHTSALQASQTPAVQTEMGVRRLTPRECERLQGW